MKRALISVSDKTGIVEFAKSLIELNFEIISTGGTLNALQSSNIKVTGISEITDFPEIMDGRVKTLHPKIHGGILYIRDNEKHCLQAIEHHILPIDMLVVNLYPFADTVKKTDSTWEDIIENIDIGGPAMLRAGAKNYKFVDVIIDKNDYSLVLDEIKNSGQTNEKTKIYLAQKVFAHVSEYDNLIANTLAGNITPLRYGENPHQEAEYIKGKPEIITQLHGKELSYNNYLDIDAALKTIYRFKEPTVAILKHTNPCGIASDNDITTAYQKAFATDTVSPFGGVIVTNANIDMEFVDTINKIFTEIVIFPRIDQLALQKLQIRKDRRLIQYDEKILQKLSEHRQISSCINGYLSQLPDLYDDDSNSWQIPTIAKPSLEQIKECKFAWQVVKMLKSNAICFTKNKQTIGMGIGQTNRIDSMNIAVDRANRMNLSLSDSVCASDGFFPFTDSIDRLAEIGVKCVIQPGGSKADPDIISACNNHNIAMLITGRRHFRH